MVAFRGLAAGIVAVVVLLLLAPWGATASPGGDADTPVQWSKVHDALRARLEDAPPEETVELVLRLVPRARLDDVRFQRDEVVARLQAAAAAQADLHAQLEAAGFAVRRGFWISNAVLVEGPAHGVADLTRLPEVGRIVENFEVTLLDGGATDVEPAGDPTWGIERIGADQVWADLGVRGQGVHLCVSDTGVDIEHPDLAGRMATDDSGDPAYPGGWIEFDSNGNPVAGSTPHDTHGHGTHTSGTALGGDDSGVAIGVAPEASLMHALVLPDGGGTFAQVLAGIEWCVAPTDDQGNPAGTPADVHSMSWGAQLYSDEMVEPIRNSYFAGTVPVAAAGNCGDGCSNSPGNLYDSLGVGASTEDDAIASFSSGEVVQKTYWSAPPADWPEEWTVPLLSAPGVNVYSAVPGGGYESWAGTSMATPHVAGCVALMRSANPSLTSDDVREVLVATAVWFDTYAPEPPDTRYGWGRLDCWTAVETVAFDSGIQGTLADQEDGEPVDQAWVNVTSTEVVRRAESDGDGAFRLSLKPGTYDLTVERFGYEPLNRTDLVVEEETWITLDLDLVPGPRGNVTGTVVHNGTGLGVPGVQVAVLDIPVTLAGTTDGSGAFAIPKVPEGTYRLRASSPYFLDATVEGVVVTDGATASVDFAVDPRDWVAVLGDHNNALAATLRDAGYYVESPTWWDVVDEPDRYRAVVVNHPEFPGSSLFADFLAATDAAGTGVVFLDTWEHTFTGGGIYYLWYYRGDPSTRDYGYDSTANHLYYNVTQIHPILDPHGVGDRIVLEDSTTYHMYAWFDGFAGENGTVLAWAGLDNQGDLGPGIAVDERANNRHVLLSLHGASNYVGPRDWTPDGRQVFLNAVAWSRGPAPDSLPVTYDLAVAPSEGLWYETFEVSLRVKNVGSGAGNYTARLDVDGLREASQTVALTSGEEASLAFAVTRDPVGTYRVTVGPHQDVFRVRPPRVTVQVEDASGAAVSGGTVLAGLGSAVMDMGRTDPNGTLTFDSPAGSHGQYWVAVRFADAAGVSHLLLQEPSVEDDLALSFRPEPDATATLNGTMEEAVPGQEGTLFLRHQDMPLAWEDDFPHPTGPVVVTRGTYDVWARTTVTDSTGTWSYDTVPVSLDLRANATFAFGGPLEAVLSWSQTGNNVTVEWTVQDAHQRALRRVTQATVGVLGPGETVDHQPLLSFWDPNGTLLRSGYVAWTQNPAQATLEEGAVAAFVHLDLVTGVYPLDNVFRLTAEVRDSHGALSSPTGATAEGTVTVNGTVLRSGEPIPATVRVNGTPVPLDGTGAFALEVNLTRGFNTLDVTAQDLAGNERSLRFVVVWKPGVLLLLDPLPTRTNASAVTVSGLVEPDAQLAVNNRSLTPGTDGRFATSVALAEGENTIVVTAVDYLGTRRVETRTVVRDTLPPALRLLTPNGDHRTWDSTVVIAGQTEPDATVTVNGEPVPTEDGGFAVEVPLHEGANVFRIRVVDAAGNAAVQDLVVHRDPSLMGVGLSPVLYAAAAAGAGLTFLFLWRRGRIPPLNREEGPRAPPGEE